MFLWATGKAGNGKRKRERETGTGNKNGTWLYEVERNACCWNLLVKCFQESESTPFNPWVIAVLNYLAVGKAGVPTSIRRSTNASLVGLYRLSYIYLQATAAVK